MNLESISFKREKVLKGVEGSNHTSTNLESNIVLPGIEHQLAKSKQKTKGVEGFIISYRPSLEGSMNNTTEDDLLNTLYDDHVLPLGLDIDELEEEYDEYVINTKDVELKDHEGVEVPVHNPLTFDHMELDETNRRREV
ncbi:hypothetical protein L2E82_33494 [Cichorium intybus]|uniref:Uncharacterized protein n=1 Tax=Cichorium intybus TaxID=13427 RepID=A0ACB9BKC2_CICIN|nr:hypothetical protein L2E82_33494 [Cichorium intybus]